MFTHNQHWPGGRGSWNVSFNFQSNHGGVEASQHVFLTIVDKWWMDGWKSSAKNNILQSLIIHEENSKEINI